MSLTADWVEEIGERTVQIAEEFLKRFREQFEGRGPYQSDVDAQTHRAWFEMNVATVGPVFVLDLLATPEGKRELARYLRTVEREDGIRLFGDEEESDGRSY